MMQPEPEPAAPETHDDGEPVEVSQAHDRLIDKMKKEVDTIHGHLTSFSARAAALFDECPPEFTVEQWDGMIDRARELETALGMHSAHALEKAGDPADSAPITAIIDSLNEEFDQVSTELTETKKAAAKELAETKKELTETKKEFDGPLEDGEQCELHAKYFAYSTFRTPPGKDLRQAHEYWVKWNTLYVMWDEGEELEEFEAYRSYEDDDEIAKRPGMTSSKGAFLPTFPPALSSIPPLF